MGCRLSPMDTAQIATLLTPFLTRPLAPAQIAQISIYIDLLLRWNARTNLTAIRTPEEIVTRHFGESLFVAQTLFPAPEESNRDPNGHAGTPGNSLALQRREVSANVMRPIGTPETPGQINANSRPLDLLDLGSGPGFPGLPIHLITPNLQTTLLESQQKKVAFLREVIRALTLTSINVYPARAEDFSHTASTVTLRAVERFDQILPTAARLVAPQGRVALLIAEPQQPRAQSALPNFSWQSPTPIPNSTARILLVGTPDGM
jgi:16S rRNA (guanine527-N7)-methyltransferase